MTIQGMPRPGSSGGEAATADMAGRDLPRDAGVNVWKGLLWREWLAQRNLIINALAVWLVCGWVLLIFFHPGFIIGFGVIYAFLAGPAFGGADAVEGSEEFSFSLPPTRSERYLARLVLGGGTVLAFTVLGVLTMALNLPQVIWGLVVNSGFTEPFPACEEGFLYPLAVAIPFAVLAFSFALAAVANTRGLVATSWFLGGMLAGAVLGLGFLGEHLLWRQLNGYVSIPALLALAPVGLLVGYLRYVRKEGVSRPTPLAGRGLLWVWVSIAIIIILFVLAVFMWWGHQDQPREEFQRAPEAARERMRRRDETGPATVPLRTAPAPAPPHRDPVEGNDAGSEPQRNKDTTRLAPDGGR